MEGVRWGRGTDIGLEGELGCAGSPSICLDCVVDEVRK